MPPEGIDALVQVDEVLKIVEAVSLGRGQGFGLQLPPPVVRVPKEQERVSEPVRE